MFRYSSLLLIVMLICIRSYSQEFYQPRWPFFTSKETIFSDDDSIWHKEINSAHDLAFSRYTYGGLVFVLQYFFEENKLIRIGAVALIKKENQLDVDKLFTEVSQSLEKSLGIKPIIKDSWPNPANKNQPDRYDFAIRHGHYLRYSYFVRDNDVICVSTGSDGEYGAHFEVTYSAKSYASYIPTD